MQLRIRSQDTRKTETIKVGKTFFYDPAGVKKNPPPGSPVSVTRPIGKLEWTIDENHGRPPYFVGGPFFQSSYESPFLVVASGRFAPSGVAIPGWSAGYEGGFVLTNLPAVAPLGSLPTRMDDYSNANLNPDDLSTLGDAAYQKLRPKVSKAGFAQAVFELREFPEMIKTSLFASPNYLRDRVRASWKAANKHGKTNPMALQNILRGHTKTLPKHVASHFLNHNFGWVPFVKDINDVINVTNNYFTNVAKLEAANNEWRSRRFFEDELAASSLILSRTRDSSSSLFLVAFSPSLGSHAKSVTWNVYREKSTRVWYEGKFKVYRPEFDKGVKMHPQIRSMRQAMAIYGMEINPLFLYKITPYSWLADWLTGFGNNIQVLQDYITGEVVSKYMYCMRETYDRIRYHAFQSNDNGSNLSGEVISVQTVKRRVAAGSPFGFTLPAGGLSGKQLAILGAIGINLL